MSMKVFVIVCSIFVVLGFITSCYLMTTVNPEPIVNTDKIISAREYVFDFENMQDNKNFRDAQYGLEKAPPSSEAAVPLPYLFRKNNPNWLSTQNDSNLRTVHPPIQLSFYSRLHLTRTSPMIVPLNNKTLSYTCQHVSKHSQVTESPKNNTLNNTDHAKMSQPVKGRRRSIDSLQKRFDEISGSVFLKIVDEHGKSRVEIKVNTEDTKTFRNKNNSIDNNSALATEDSTKDFFISLDELPDRTEIRILHNATLVVSDVSEESESKLDMRTEKNSPKTQTNQRNAKHTSKYVISRPGSNEPTAAMTVASSNTNHIIQRTTKSVTQLLNAASTGNLALKVLFDNVTRSFKRETYGINRYLHK